MRSFSLIENLFLVFFFIKNTPNVMSNFWGAVHYIALFYFNLTLHSGIDIDKVSILVVNFQKAFFNSNFFNFRESKIMC